MIGYCKHCNLPFDVSYLFQEGTIRLEGCTIPCPNCGQIGDLLDGTYQRDINGIVNLLSGSAFTRNKLLQLKELALRAKEGQVDYEQFEKEVKTLGVNDSFLQRMKPKTPEQFAAYIMAFLTALGILLTYIKDDKPTIIYKSTTINNYGVRTQKEKKEGEQRDVAKSEHEIRRKARKDQRKG